MQIAAFKLFTSLAIAILLLSSCQSNEESKEELPFLPQPYFVLLRGGYSAGYDGRLKQASWVYEELTREKLEGEADRLKCKFCEDEWVPKVVRALLSDYVGCGYDRGHLAPAANYLCSQKQMEDTFLLSNISPQTPAFNRGYWRKLEKHVRDLTREYGKVKVVTGPLFLPEEAHDGKKYVIYEVIGDNNVAVPTHFFKAIWTPEGVEAYILPNRKISPDTPLESFRETIEKVKRVAGMVLPLHHWILSGF